MARLGVLPAEAIISMFRGTIDYYLWKGIPCARRWPRSPGPERSPTLTPAIQRLAYASWMWATLTPTVRSAYQSISSNTGLTNKDYSVRAYSKGIAY